MAIQFYLSPKLNKKDEALIRISISIRGTRLVSTTGLSIPPKKWNASNKSVFKCTNSKGMSSTQINSFLRKIEANFADFESKLDHTPDSEELADILANSKGKQRRKKRSEEGEPMNVMSCFDEFVLKESLNSMWSEGTLSNWSSFRKHLENSGYTKFRDFSSGGVQDFIEYLREERQMAEVTVQKQFRNLKWFLNWCVERGYCRKEEVLHHRIKFKVEDKPVVFLTKDEMLKVFHYRIPTEGTKVRIKDYTGKCRTITVRDTQTLNEVRDLFCFCCFTSLRFSDMSRLKAGNVTEKCIVLNSKKTGDRLEIDLNDAAKSIIEKYRHRKQSGDTIFPRVSYQIMNRRIKELCELCEINTPVSRTYYKAGRKIETIEPKYKLIGTHAGRRSFICHALSQGISPQIIMKWTGHNDYKSMKPYIDIASDAKAEAMKLFKIE